MFAAFRFGDSVLVVFVVSDTDETCGLENSSSNDAERTKTFTFVLSDEVSKARLELQVLARSNSRFIFI